MPRLVLLVLVLAAPAVWSYPKFKDEIPNGHFVPNPCYDVKGGKDQIWGGLGHKNIRGGGDLNPFGHVSVGSPTNVCCGFLGCLFIIFS